MKWGMLLGVGVLGLTGCASVMGPKEPDSPPIGRATVKCIITKKGRAEQCRAITWDPTVSNARLAQGIRDIESTQYGPEEGERFGWYAEDHPYTFELRFRDPPVTDGGVAASTSSQL
ncbi:hypothetical protein HPP05_17800 [Corallococcus exiguus]|uniref:hypothetical protein n=1 Tax=Corallococcus TaxID=83461 RepID=UPI0011C497CA|nr:MULTISPECIES: hypothetical protein [Corallococcus]NPC71608.1 hypothetical protein [Corallococcus exiguus]NRD45933.1 hypothetical protein [Corallococcus exiguus]